VIDQSQPQTRRYTFASEAVALIGTSTFLLGALVRNGNLVPWIQDVRICSQFSEGRVGCIAPNGLRKKAVNVRNTRNALALFDSLNLWHVDLTL
jgi:hypothetical protein